MRSGRVRGRRRPTRMEPPEALLDPLLGEGLQEIVDDAELEGFDRVILERGRENEHRRRRAARARVRTSSRPASISVSRDPDVHERRDDGEASES